MNLSPVKCQKICTRLSIVRAELGKLPTASGAYDAYIEQQRLEFGEDGEMLASLFVSTALAQQNGNHYTIGNVESIMDKSVDQSSHVGRDATGSAVGAGASATTGNVAVNYGSGQTVQMAPDEACAKAHEVIDASTELDQEGKAEAKKHATQLRDELKKEQKDPGKIKRLFSFLSASIPAEKAGEFFGAAVAAAYKTASGG